MSAREAFWRVMSGVGVVVLFLAVATIITNALPDQPCILSEDRPIYQVDGTIELPSSPLRKYAEVKIVDREGEWVTVEFAGETGRVHDPDYDLCGPEE